MKTAVRKSHMETQISIKHLPGNGTGTAFRNFLLFALLLSTTLSLGARNPLEPVYYPAPPSLPNTTPEMQTAGYWIARHPQPDALIMNSAQIARYNERVYRQGSYTKIHQASSYYSGNMVRSMINDHFRTLAAIARYDSTGARVSGETWARMRQNAALDRIPATVKVRFGFPVTLADQRLAPSSANLNNKQLDVEFDELQNSGYDIGTPTVFYHDSADGQWVYGACATTVGWYRKSQVCFVSQREWLAYQTAERKVVCLNARNDLWADSTATRYLSWCRMGTAFPLVAEGADYYQVQVPLRNPDGSGSLGTAYIARQDASLGFLPYTARNVYRQAFRLLHMGYGWGDTRGDFDCSSLLKHLFSCFGINLPRNGRTQAATGSPLHNFSSGEIEAQRTAAILRKGKPGISFLQMSGHIMLYLGEANGRVYAIHDAWGIRKPNPGAKEDDVYVISRTVVSDLSLGTGSKKGSLLHRLVSMTAIAN